MAAGDSYNDTTMLAAGPAVPFSSTCQDEFRSCRPSTATPTCAALAPRSGVTDEAMAGRRGAGGGPAIDYRQLRPAIELHRQRTALAKRRSVIPQALLRSSPPVSAERGSGVGRAIEADDEFRAAVAATLDGGSGREVAGADLDAASRLWLTRPAGWRAELDELLRERRRQTTAAAHETAERKERRRREAAEDALAASREEAAALAARLATVQSDLAAANGRLDRQAAQVEQLRGGSPTPGERRHPGSWSHRGSRSSRCASDDATAAPLPAQP